MRAVIGETDYLGELTGNYNSRVSGENAYFHCYIFFVTKELKIIAINPVKDCKEQCPVGYSSSAPEEFEPN